METTYTFSGELPPIDFGDAYLWVMPTMDEPRHVLYDESRFVPCNEPVHIPCKTSRFVSCNVQYDTSRFVPLTSRIKYNPNMCTECKKVFARAWMKRDHMKRDHPETYPYKCEKCDCQYSSKGGLSGHRSKIHGKRDIRNSLRNFRESLGAKSLD